MHPAEGPEGKRVGEVGYTDVQLRDMIAKMRAVTTSFYPAAADTGCHAFIEFTGLMHEFIKVCEQSLAEEVDFATSNTHSGRPLVVHPFNADYIVEKLDCIFGPSIKASPEVRAAFAKLTEDEGEAAAEPEPVPAPPTAQEMKARCFLCNKARSSHMAGTLACPIGWRRTRTGFAAYHPFRCFEPRGALRGYPFDMDVDTLNTIRWSLHESVERQKTLVALSRSTVSKGMLAGFTRTLKDLEKKSALMEAFADKIVSGGRKRGAE